MNIYTLLSINTYYSQAIYKDDYLRLQKQLKYIDHMTQGRIGQYLKEEDFSIKETIQNYPQEEPTRKQLTQQIHRSTHRFEINFPISPSGWFRNFKTPHLQHIEHIELWVGGNPIEMVESSLIPALQKLYHISDPEVIPFCMTTQNYLKSLYYNHISINILLKENHELDNFIVEYDVYQLNNDNLYYNHNTKQNYRLQHVQGPLGCSIIQREGNNIPFAGKISHIIIKTKAKLHRHVALKVYKNDFEYFMIEKIPLTYKLDDVYVYQLTSQATNGLATFRFLDTYLVMDDFDPSDLHLQMYVMNYNIYFDCGGVGGLRFPP